MSDTSMPGAAVAASPTAVAVPSVPSESRYLVKSLLPRREVSIMSGASGAGKTTLTLQLLAAIANGEATFLGLDIIYPCKVAYIAADRTWESYRELAARVRLDTSRMEVRSLVDDESIDCRRLEHDSMGLLKQMLLSLDHPDLVVVDPGIIFLGVDPNRYHQVAPRLIQMGRWCRTMNLTILATHHASKARTDFSFKRPQDRISGSSALNGFTSTQMFLASPEEIGKPYAEFVAINHNDAPISIRLKRDSSGLFVPFTDDTVNQAFVQMVMDAVDRSGRPMSKAAIQTVTRIDGATLDDLLDHLVTAQVMKVSGRGEFKLVMTGGQRPS